VTLTELITIKNGAVEQSNFYDYHVPRMKDVPPMHIEVIQTDNHPTGAGQMATPLVAPAIAGAVAELTGVRLRHTPFLPERVKKAGLGLTCHLSPPAGRGPERGERVRTLGKSELSGPLTPRPSPRKPGDGVRGLRKRI
jgi:hypothetical protein